MLPIILSFVVSAAFTWLFTSRFTPLKVLDHPNERSLHEIPVHRTGGMAILIAVVTSLFLSKFLGFDVPISYTLMVCTAVLLIVSFLDDLKDIAIGVRFLSQIVVAVVASYYLLEVQSLWMLPVAITLVWMINLYNFMDGMDGFAGGMSVTGFGFLGIIALQQGDDGIAMNYALMAAASAGFLLFNFPPARIFMGDAGSTLMGFFAGIAIIFFHIHDLLFAGLGVLLFSPFIVDATVTLLSRMLRGERFWQAHRTHYYQRLVQAGWGHRRTVLAEYGLMLACGLTVISVKNQPSLHWPVIVIWLLVYATLMVGLEKTVLRKA